MVDTLLGAERSSTPQQHDVCCLQRVREQSQVHLQQFSAPVCLPAGVAVTRSRRTTQWWTPLGCAPMQTPSLSCR